ncbi:MAG: hydroxyacylglutathione hydrolase [Burkholderiales bacterium]
MSPSFQVIPIQAFNDNYVWCIRDRARAVVVDPGDADPVFAYLAVEHLQLSAILATHHHNDHVGGIGALVTAHPVPVYAPFDERIDYVTHRVRDGDVAELHEFELTLRVVEIPGHTRTHIAYYGANLLFCGDTLFACGCGRLFEGTPAQMHASLAKLAALPDDTRVYCGHEYTRSNLRFGRTVDPTNPALADWEREADEQRSRNRPTLPSLLAREKQANPFLRCEDPVVVAAANRYAAETLSDPVKVFAALREWKNRF